MQRICAGLLLLCLPYAPANAFWQFLLGEGAAARAVVGSAARGAAVGAAERSAIGAGVRSGGAAARVMSVSRFCVRPRGERACLFHTASDAEAAAKKAVRVPYRVRTTGDPTIFEVLDTVGNIVSMVEAIDTSKNESVNSSPEYLNPSESEAIDRPIVEPVRIYPTRTLELPQRGWLSVPTDGFSYEIWSDGYVNVSADATQHWVRLQPNQRLRFDAVGTIHVTPLSAAATTLFAQPSTRSSAPERARQNSSSTLYQPRPGEIFPYGTHTSCPQVPVGNGMVRCQ